MLLGSSPFPKGVWTQTRGRGSREGQAWTEQDPGAALGTGMPATPHPSGRPAQPASAHPQRWPLLPRASMPTGGSARWQGKSGCCFPSPPAAHSPTAQRGREAGLRGPGGASSSEERAEQLTQDCQEESGFSTATSPKLLANFCHPPPRPKESFGKGRPHLVSWRASPAGALP